MRVFFLKTESKREVPLDFLDVDDMRVVGILQNRRRYFLSALERMTRRGKTTETRHFLPFSFFCVCARFLIFSFFAFLLLLSILEGMDDNGESTSKKKNEKKNYVQEGFEEGAAALTALNFTT